MLEAHGHKLGDGLDNGQVGARVLVLAHEVGVVAPRHARARGGLAVHRKLGRHAKRRRELGRSAKRHEHGCGANGGVEPLCQALVGRHVEVAHQRDHLLRKSVAGPLVVVLVRCAHAHRGGLGRAVGREELAAHVHDGLAAPGHAQAGLLGDLGDNRGLEVLFVRVAQELVHVLGRQRHGHALLRLGDGKLGAVEAVVLLGHAVKVDEKPVGKLADGNRDTAGAKVVAALDEAARVAAAEESLQLALGGGVALLDLGAVLLERLHVVRLRAARGSANAVTAGTAAEKHDLVARRGALSAHVACGRRAHHGANLHALGHVAGMVELGDLAGGKADLVAVGGVSGGCGAADLALRELAGKRARHRCRGVCRAGYAHGLVHVAAARERVADGAADAGCRAAKRLNLGGVVVRLVLEEVEPVLVVAVDVDLGLHGAGVDLLGLVQAGKLARVFEPLGANGAHVHKADGLVVAAELVTDVHVAAERSRHLGVVELDVAEGGTKGGMAAVVGPIGVDHADLGDGGHAPLVRKVALAELGVGHVHGQSAVAHKVLDALLVQIEKPVQDLDVRRLGVCGGEGLALLERRLARLDRVDHVALDGVEVLVGERALQHVDLGVSHRGALALRDELDALGRRGVAHVELTGQGLHGKDARALRHLGHLARGAVGLRLGEDYGHALFEELLRDALDVVAVDDAQVRERRDAQHVPQLVAKRPCLPVESVPFLNVDARDHRGHLSCWVWAEGVAGATPRRTAHHSTAAVSSASEGGERATHSLPSSLWLCGRGGFVSRALPRKTTAPVAARPGRQQARARRASRPRRSSGASP